MNWEGGDTFSWWQLLVSKECAQRCAVTKP